MAVGWPTTSMVPVIGTDYLGLGAKGDRTIRRWIGEGAVYQNHWAFEPIERLTQPAVTAGPEKTTRKRTAGSREAASGMIQPAWLWPARPCF